MSGSPDNEQKQAEDAARIRWHVYADSQDHGPYSPEEMARIYELGLITETSFIRQAAWDTWVPCGEVLKTVAVREVSREVSLDLGSPEGHRARRLNLVDRPGCEVLIHDHQKLVKATAVNLSKSGMFVATQRPEFPLGTDVVVVVKARGILPAFNVKGRIVRFTKDPRFPVGYGLKFFGVPPVLEDL